MRLHVGVNRLEDSFQRQIIAVPSDTTGTREVVFLDRQRTVVSLRGSQRLEISEDLSLGLVLYGEAHTLPSGIRMVEKPRHQKTVRMGGSQWRPSSRQTCVQQDRLLTSLG